MKFILCCEFSKLYLEVVGLTASNNFAFKFDKTNAKQVGSSKWNKENNSSRTIIKFSCNLNTNALFQRFCLSSISLDFHYSCPVGLGPALTLFVASPVLGKCEKHWRESADPDIALGRSAGYRDAFIAYFYVVY